MPRYAILSHDHPFPHWDFLLESESGGPLRAWRLLTKPAPGVASSAEPLPDHRPVYLEYEGPVSGDRGTVTRWDGGEFDWSAPATSEQPSDAAATAAEAVVLRGGRGLRGARLEAVDGRIVWRFE